MLVIGDNFLLKKKYRYDINIKASRNFYLNSGMCGNEYR